MSWNKWWGNLFKKKVKPKQIEKPKTVETAKPKPKLERIKPKPKLDTVPLFPTTARRCGEIDYLHPALRIGVITALEHCHQEGLMIHVFESYRTPARQQELFDKGRNTPGRKVTNARPFQSFHNYGLAFDLVFDGDDRDGIQWSWEGDYNNKVIEGDKRSDYQRAGEIFELYGFEWGARWRTFKEMPHFQKVFGLQHSALKAIYNESGMQAVWDKVSDLERQANLTS